MLNALPPISICYLKLSCMKMTWIQAAPTFKTLFSRKVCICTWPSSDDGSHMQSTADWVALMLFQGKKVIRACLLITCPNCKKDFCTYYSHSNYGSNDSTVTLNTCRKLKMCTSISPSTNFRLMWWMYVISTVSSIKQPPIGGRHLCKKCTRRTVFSE